MIRTASDLSVGSHILDGDRILVVDYLVVDEDGIWIEGYELDSGDEFNMVYDEDDEINIVK